MTRRRVIYVPQSSTPATITLGRTATGYVNGAGGAYTVGWSSGGAVAAGTLLIAVVEESTDSGSHPYITGGSAWTRVGTTKMYYKIAGASEPTTYSISYAGSSKSEGSAVLVLEVFGATSVTAVTATNTATAPTVGPVSATDMVLVAGGYAGAVTLTPPTGWTKQPAVAQNASVCIGTKLTAGSGGNVSPGNWNFTLKRAYTLIVS